MGWTVKENVEEFWRATEPYLRAHRVTSTIVLSIVDTLRTRSTGAYSGPPELAWWDPGDGVSGLIVHTPPYRPLVSTMSAEAAAAWTVGRPRPERILGPSDTVEHLAQAWGAVPEVIVAERLHRLDVLRSPGNPAPTRIAGDAERNLLWAWLQAFRDEAVPNDPPPDRAPLDAAVDEGRIAVAVPDGEPVAYAAVSPSLMRSSRIAPVYTPPAHRGRGYGAAVTAAAARIALARGDEEVLLFTDLANPTSNRLYARLGFVGVADIVDAALMPVAGSRSPGTGLP
ncbi:GNAT family N-acetyltransferase [Actinomycetospora callitridis]|jgi:GNAT superfamily N-acetyltransferase|uniref:GNAT family N-acetyltransferase n=1 Tax=Actinomycetospora callitridis TaxID=913944 RepID=UPI002365F9A5|nr:GNAT family N-acetyltransferase [Actinomycetospora callitridis]MDD7918278.1 GNAT family N-acetyltransferase [Actinomycetospora callitridis]